ncbi:hypothetical protein ACWC21_07830, partial [Streptomyces sp. NPDC001348]
MAERPCGGVSPPTGREPDGVPPRGRGGRPSVFGRVPEEPSPVADRACEETPPPTGQEPDGVPPR